MTNEDKLKAIAEAFEKYQASKGMGAWVNFVVEVQKCL